MIYAPPFLCTFHLLQGVYVPVSDPDYLATLKAGNFLSNDLFRSETIPRQDRLNRLRLGMTIEGKSYIGYDQSR